MFLCEVCGKSFSTHLHLKRHIHTVHSKSFQATCKICKTELKRKDNLKRHMEIHNKEKTNKQLLCEICGLCFTSAKMMNKHLTKHTQGMITLYYYYYFIFHFIFIFHSSQKTFTFKINTSLTDSNKNKIMRCLSR